MPFERATVSFEEVSVVRETADAILVRFGGADGPDGEHWVPKSQVHDDSEVWETGQFGELVITEWLAEQRGWV